MRYSSVLVARAEQQWGFERSFIDSIVLREEALCMYQPQARTCFEFLGPLGLGCVWD